MSPRREARGLSPARADTASSRPTTDGPAGGFTALVLPATELDRALAMLLSCVIVVPFVHHHTARFFEIDRAGIVFFGRIFEFCHEAFEELLLAID
jgi:hypothetical protein